MALVRSFELILSARGSLKGFYVEEYMRRFMSLRDLCGGWIVREGKTGGGGGGSFGGCDFRFRGGGAGFCCMDMGAGTYYVHFGGKSTGFADGLNVDCDSG